MKAKSIQPVWRKHLRPVVPTAVERTDAQYATVVNPFISVRYSGYCTWNQFLGTMYKRASLYGNRSLSERRSRHLTRGYINKNRDEVIYSVGRFGGDTYVLVGPADTSSISANDTRVIRWNKRFPNRWNINTQE